MPPVLPSRCLLRASPRRRTAAPIKLGFQVHRTGIGAGYGRWYERVATAAATRMNGMGGINGRPVELVFEDDGTDPKRGAEVVDKLVSQHGVDLIFGSLFSHVVIGSAPRAGELKVPYLPCSEGYHVASGMLNRWCLQPGISDVRAQVTAMAPWSCKIWARRSPCSSPTMPLAMTTATISARPWRRRAVR